MDESEGQPRSKTLARVSAVFGTPTGFGVRQPGLQSLGGEGSSAAFTPNSQPTKTIRSALRAGMETVPIPLPPQGGTPYSCGSTTTVIGSPQGGRP